MFVAFLAHPQLPSPIMNLSLFGICVTWLKIEVASFDLRINEEYIWTLSDVLSSYLPIQENIFCGGFSHLLCFGTNRGERERERSSFYSVRHLNQIVKVDFDREARLQFGLDRSWRARQIENSQNVFGLLNGNPMAILENSSYSILRSGFIKVDGSTLFYLFLFIFQAYFMIEQITNEVVNCENKYNYSN